MALKLITAPVLYPVTLAEAKAQCRVDGSEEDDLIEAMLQAAIGNLDGADGWLGRALCEQTWELVLDDFPATEEIRVPLPPLLEVVSLKYLDADLVERTIDPDDYMVDTDRQPGWVVPGAAGWPAVGDSINAVRLRFRCGWEDSGGSPAAWAGPAPIKAAIRLMLADLYQNREGQFVGITVARNPAVEALLTPYRVGWFG